MCTDEDETVDVEGDSELEDWPEAQKRRNDSLVAGFSGKFVFSCYDEVLGCFKL